MDKKLLNNIIGQLTHLHYKWQIYRNVYAVDEKQIEILNHVDSEFFGTVQELYLNAIILNISKLTDKGLMNGNRNASLVGLVENIVDKVDITTKNELNQKLNELTNITKKFRKYRSKSIAHSDYKLHVKESYELDGVSRKDIEDALNVFTELLDIITGYFEESTTLFNISPPDGGSILIKKLEKIEL